MEEIKINQYHDQKYDVATNLFYEDVWDDVFGMEEWADNDDEAVGFVDGKAVRSVITEGNTIKFYPFNKGDYVFSFMRTLADTILRAVEFCIARVFHECQEPSFIHEIRSSEHEINLGDDSGIAVRVFFDDFAVYLSFFKK